jgi:hypothetical protein
MKTTERSVIDDFRTPSDEALRILNSELERRGREERFTSRMITEYRRRGTGPSFVKFGTRVFYGPKPELVAWLNQRFSAPVRSIRELRAGA